MSSSSRLRPLSMIVFVAVLGAAFWAGRMSASRPEMPSPVVQPVPPRVPAGRGPRPLPLAVTNPASSCEQRLALATGLLEAAEKARVGTPVPFPEALDPEFAPSGFERAVKEALDGCPGSGLELARVDCDEFPCMAYFSQPPGTWNHGADELAACTSWTDRFGDRGRSQANSSFVTAKGETEWSVLVPRPEGVVFDENLGIRWNVRREDGEAELMAEWGGRPPTDKEKLQQEIDFWESVGDQGGLLPDLRAQLATLEEKEGGDGVGDDAPTGGAGSTGD